MKAYAALPNQLVDGWSARVQSHPPGAKVDLHYHDVEEWLEVVRGEMTFYPLSGRGWPLEAGDAFHLLRGEVHRVDIGEKGAEYRMYAEIPADSPFVSHTLAPEDVALLRTNLEFPTREENADGRAAEFFAAHLSDALAFARADASVVGKDAFRSGFAARGRASSGSVCVLNRGENGILLSTVVTVGAGQAAKAFNNVRLFVREPGGWKCRIWANYPQPVERAQNA